MTPSAFPQFRACPIAGGQNRSAFRALTAGLKGARFGGRWSGAKLLVSTRTEGTFCASGGQGAHPRERLRCCAYLELWEPFRLAPPSLSGTLEVLPPRLFDPQIGPKLAIQVYESDSLRASSPL